MPQEADTSGRLPKNVKPTNYWITLEPDFDTFTFSGRVVVDIDAREETSEIVLNAKELTIHSAQVTQDFQRQDASSIVLDPVQERAVFTFSKPLLLGTAELAIEFEGVLNDQLAGFYRSTYDVNGEKKVMAITHFEDTDARRAFPCWDEPAIKATFKLALLVPHHLDVLSNMPILVDVWFSPEKKLVSFEKTPVMSTYLLAFAVGEFEYVSSTISNGTLVRVITTPGKKEQGLFALDVGVRCVEFYNEYFGIPYPLPKLDMIAIPDFAAGAMENWGLITYREARLLIDPQRSSASVKQGVALVIAHEIAHQWFGNLVTMEYWTQLWLNEGFASWMEYLAVDTLFPGWHLWDQFFMDYISALQLDGLRTTHPIEVTINHPSEIGQNFDAISYAKGAVIINMIYRFIGPESFRRGLQAYLTRHAYGNAVTEDLWQALEEVSGKPVRAMMDTWTKQPGYPVVRAERINDSEITLTQDRFLASGVELTQEELEQVWSLVLPYKTKRHAGSFVLDASQEKVSFSIPKDTWIKFNTGHTSLLRVQYPPEILDKLSRAKLSTIDTAGILNDLAALAQAGKISASDLLLFLRNVNAKKECITWQEIVGALREISSLLPEEGTARNEFNAFAQYKLVPVVQELGWDARPDDGHLDVLLRPLVLSAHGFWGATQTIGEAQRRFELFVEDPCTLDPNLRDPIFNLVAKNGTAETLEQLLMGYRRAQRQEDKVYLLRALGRFQDPELFKRVLKFSLSSEVRSQDMIFIFVGVGVNSRESHAIAWEFAKEHWELLKSKYEGAIFLMGRLIDTLVSSFDTEERAQEVEVFFIEHPVPEASQAIAQALEKIRAQAAWILRDRTAVEDWLGQWIRSA